MEPIYCERVLPNVPTMRRDQLELDGEMIRISESSALPSAGSTLQVLEREQFYDEDCKRQRWLFWARGVVRLRAWRVDDLESTLPKTPTVSQSSSPNDAASGTTRRHGHGTRHQQSLSCS